MHVGEEVIVFDFPALPGAVGIISQTGTCGKVLSMPHEVFLTLQVKIFQVGEKRETSDKNL